MQIHIPSGNPGFHSKLLSAMKKSLNFKGAETRRDETRVARWYIFRPKPHFLNLFEGLGIETFDIF
jgi:hypothetical protein